MTRNRCRAFVAAAILLSGCASQPLVPDAVIPAVDLDAEYRALAAAAGGRVFALDPASSRVRIYAFRGGLAARLGHNHVLGAPRFEGYVWLPDAGLADARFDLRFALAELSLDEPQIREETGGSFASPLDDAAIERTRRNLLGPRGLDAERHPEVRVRSVKVAGALPWVVATVALTLHGETRELLVPLAVVVDDTRLHVRGAFALRQTDFGVTPYSVLGGTLAVQDEVAVELELAGRPLEETRGQ